MREVYFDTETTIFRFCHDDVVGRLSYYESTLGSTEATTLRHLLSHSDHSIIIPREHYRFAYLALDLIEQRKGVVYCKACKRYYVAKELKRVVVGHGGSPFSLNVKVGGRLRRLSKKGRLPAFGGKRYRCPGAHDLIGLVTWKT